MAKQESVKVTIINRNYPPGQGITGESAAELAEFLIACGCQVNIVHINTKYKGGHLQIKAPGTVHRVHTFYSGKSKFLRLIANLYEGFRLVIKAKSIRSDMIICMTDPPLLNLWAALLLGRTQRWILWAMDLYPEAFVSAKLVSQQNPIYKIINKILLRNSPSCIINLGEFQKQSLQSKYGGKIRYINLPCGIYNKSDIENKNPKRPSWAEDNNKIYLGYCGNIGEAHSKEFLISVINHFDPSRYKLVLALYGTHAATLINYAKHKPGVIIVDNVNRSELGCIDIHLASLTQEWVNVSVPSKTVSSVCAGSAFLYNGVINSDNWALLQSAGWIIDTDDIDRDVKSFFYNLTIQNITQKKEAAKILASDLNELKSKAFFEIFNEITAPNSCKVGEHNIRYAPPSVV